MRKTHLLHATSVVALMTSIAATPVVPAFAQGGLEEIIVTARKREESLMQVPLAIAAVTSADIENAGVKDLNTLALYTPGMWAQQGVINRQTRQLTFRGLSVASGQLFIDGAPYVGTGAQAAGGGGTPDLQDVERVEVLVGPQSVYFGRSTFTGAVNFVTRDPGNEFKGRLKVEYGKFGTTDDSLSFEGPIIADKLTARVSGHHYSTNGQYTNAANPSETLGSQATNSVSGTFAFTPTDNFKARLLLSYLKDEDGAPAQAALKGKKELFCDAGGYFGTARTAATASPYACGAIPTLGQVGLGIVSGDNVIDPYLYNVLINNKNPINGAPSGYPSLFDQTWMTHFGFKQVTLVGHLNLDYEFENGWSVSGITALHKTKVQSIVSPNYRDDRDVPNPGYAASPLNRRTFLGYQLLSQNVSYDGSQEIRFTSPQKERLRGTFGGNYLSYRTPGALGPYGQTPNGPAFTGSQSRITNSTPAVFGAVYYDLIDDVTLGAEARYQWDKITATPKYPVAGAKLESTYKSFSPRVTLDYKYAANSVAYGLWSRGYRPGGFNASIVGQPASVLSQFTALNVFTAYSQEKLDNYELGLKSTWLDGNLQTRLDGYYQTWRNGQVPNTIVYTTPANTQVQTTLIKNVGAVDLYGVEFEADYAVTEHLKVSGTFAYQTSKIKSYDYVPEGPRINGTVSQNGHKFQGSPDFTWTLSPTYTAHLTGDWDWYSRLDWKHRGKYFIDPTNVAWISPANVVDLRLGVKKDANLTLEAYVTNLFDDDHFVSGEKGNDSLSGATANQNEIRVVLPQRRSFGVKASYSF